MTNPILKYLSKNQFIAALLLIALGWLLYLIRNILVAFFLAYIVMAALATPVEFLKRRRIPKILAVFIVYFATVIFLVMLIVPLIPFFAAQIESLFVRFPVYVDEVARLFKLKVDSSQINSIITSELATIGPNALGLTQQVFGGLFSILTILIVSFYLLIDRDRIKKGLASLFPKENESQVLSTLVQIEDKLGAWLRGQIFLSLSIGVLTWFALTILGLDFALPLALLAGMLEIAPTIGPILSSVPGIIVALTITPTMAITVTLVYFVIQTVENNFLVPRIMARAVGLHPLVIILGIIIGGELMGVIGALLSVPFITMIIIIFHNIKTLPK